LILAQNVTCDGLCNALDELKPALRDQIPKASGQFPVVNGIGNLIASSGRLRINLQFEINDQWLPGLPFPRVDADDGLDTEPLDSQAVHQGGDASSVMGQRGLTTTA